MLLKNDKLEFDPSARYVLSSQVDFEDDVVGLWDASRFNEPNYPHPRYIFGEFLVAGREGATRLYRIRTEW